jgi:hypothetical protein
LKKEVATHAQEEFERFMANRKNRDKKSELLINAYESVLTKERKKERQILNKVRDKEIQKNRPPQDQWYELKSSEFNQECYRNRVALKPNG